MNDRYLRVLSSCMYNKINVSAFLRLSETLRSETHVVEAAAEAEREAKQWSGASREEREER